MITYCDINTCGECPRYGDDCDGDKRVEHTDYISRADALEQMAQAECGLHYDDCEADNCSCSYIQRILDIPSADAEPKWNCTANFIAEQLERLKDMTDEERLKLLNILFPHRHMEGETMSDYISRADAMRKIKNAENELTDEAERKGLRVARFIIGELPSADAEWIPCSERLPLVSGEFLVTLVDHDGTWVSTAQWDMTFGGRWQDIFPNDGYRDISNVIAWKALPTPYKGGDDE